MRGFYTAFIYSIYTYNIHTNMVAAGMSVYIDPPTSNKKNKK